MAVSRVEDDKLAVHVDALGRNSFFTKIRDVYRASKSSRWVSFSLKNKKS